MLSNRDAVVYHGVELFTIVQVDALQFHEAAYVPDLVLDEVNEVNGLEVGVCQHCCLLVVVKTVNFCN